MTAITLQKKLGAIDTFHIKGEKFVVLKKEYLDELLILMSSVVTGEKLLQAGQTRSFGEFLKAVSRKKR